MCEELLDFLLFLAPWSLSSVRGDGSPFGLWFVNSAKELESGSGSIKAVTSKCFHCRLYS